MPIIKPCADLRNSYNEISKLCHTTNEPIFITKNGVNDLVLLSDESYELLKKRTITEDELDRILEEKFDKKFATFEEFEKDFWRKIEASIKESEEGKDIPFEEVAKEMEEKYDIQLPH